MGLGPVGCKGGASGCFIRPGTSTGGIIMWVPMTEDWKRVR